SVPVRQPPVAARGEGRDVSRSTAAPPPPRAATGAAPTRLRAKSHPHEWLPRPVFEKVAGSRKRVPSGGDGQVEFCGGSSAGGCAGCFPGGDVESRRSVPARDHRGVSRSPWKMWSVARRG